MSNVSRPVPGGQKHSWQPNLDHLMKIRLSGVNYLIWMLSELRSNRITARVSYNEI